MTIIDRVLRWRLHRAIARGDAVVDFDPPGMPKEFLSLPRAAIYPRRVPIIDRHAGFDADVRDLQAGYEQAATGHATLRTRNRRFVAYSVPTPSRDWSGDWRTLDGQSMLIAWCIVPNPGFRL